MLGLVLKYLKSTAAIQYELCGMFGMVPTTVSIWIDNGLTGLLKALWDKSFIQARVAWPSVQEMNESANLLRNNRKNGKVLKNVFGVIDGGRMLCADYEHPDLQNAYYEGYTGNVEVTCMFVFNFFGEIIHAGVNYPGSWHDKKVVIASDMLLDRLSDAKTPVGYVILGDSAFIVKTKVTGGKNHSSEEVHRN